MESGHFYAGALSCSIMSFRDQEELDREGASLFTCEPMRVRGYSNEWRSRARRLA